MKIIPFKNHLQAAALGALLVFAAGCEKEMPANSQEATEALPAASFTKQLTIGANNRSTASFVVEVGASEQHLLDEIDANSFAIQFNPESTTESGVTEPHSHDDAAEGVSVSLKGRPLLTMAVLGAYSESPLESYKVDFSKEFQKLIERSNAVLSVDLGPSNKKPVLSLKTSDTYYDTPHCLAIEFWGNNAGVKEKVRVYYPKPYPLTGSYNHPLTFHNYLYCRKCDHDDAPTYAPYLNNFLLYEGLINGYRCHSVCYF